MSLDGFVADEDGSVGRLYPDRTGSVLMGRRAFEMGDPDWFVGNYEFQVPIFVLTHHPPAKHPKEDDRLTFTFVDDLASAVRQAQAAAGDKDVTVIGGASVIRQLLNARLVDELRVDIMPVVLGGGLRFLEGVDPARVSLEKVGAEQIGARTSLAYRVNGR
jgi:dihydrofolate reductase